MPLTQDLAFAEAPMPAPSPPNTRRQRHGPRRPSASKPRIDDPVVQQVAKAFGSQLQRTRRARGWKQDAFAKAFGVSRTTVSNIERGAQRIFLDQVYRAASILGVPVDTLLPQAHLIVSDPIMHAAADAPITRSMARTLARTVEEVIREVSQENAGNSPRPIRMRTSLRPIND